VSLLELHQVPKRYDEEPTEVHAVQDINLPVNAGARIRMILAMGRVHCAARCAGAASMPIVPP
jgi:hypothetical protein